MKKVLVVLILPLLLTACNFSKSVKKDLITGLTSSGNVLSCDDIYLEVNKEKVNRNVFTYGEKFYLYFNDIKGFAQENGKTFPGMRLLVTNEKGEEVFKVDDLHADLSDGVDYSPLLLYADVIVAKPMHSGLQYHLDIHIWDKKGNGTFDVRLPFTVRPNDKIAVEAKNITYTEIYLYSENQDQAITDNKIKYDDNIYVILEGLEGFTVENGLVYPGLSLVLNDSEGSSILNYENLFTEYSKNGVDPAAVMEQVSAHFAVTGAGAENPLHCIITIRDMKSDAQISVKTDMTIE